MSCMITILPQEFWVDFKVSPTNPTTTTITFFDLSLIPTHTKTQRILYHKRQIYKQTSKEGELILSLFVSFCSHKLFRFGCYCNISETNLKRNCKTLPLQLKVYFQCWGFLHLIKVKILIYSRI